MQALPPSVLACGTGVPFAVALRLCCGPGGEEARFAAHLVLLGPAPRRPPETEHEAVRLEVELVVVGRVEDPQDVPDVLLGEDHARPNASMTWSKARAFGAASGSVARLDHAVSGRLWSR